jgi:DNA invertase Pin-like site-specific DNA recombinase
MPLIGYARVSTEQQIIKTQLDALKSAGCERTFSDDGVSGKLASRPQLDLCLAYLRAGDTLAVTKLDRLGRSLKHLIELSNDLAQAEVNLRVLDQGIDTSTPGGRLFFHMVGAFAEFERDLIVERTMDGLATARAAGRFGGRPAKLTARQIEHLRADVDARKCTITELAADYGVSRPTVYRALKSTP